VAFHDYWRWCRWRPGFRRAQDGIHRIRGLWSCRSHRGARSIHSRALNHAGRLHPAEGAPAATSNVVVEKLKSGRGLPTVENGEEANAFIRP
jgi:hypothetical protein